MSADQGRYSDFAARAPSPALRPYIAYYAGFRANELAPSTHSGVPTHHLVLAISLSKPIDIVRSTAIQGGAASLQAFVSGFQLAPNTIGYGTSRDGLFVHLTPSGVQAVLGVPSLELASRVVDLCDI